MSKAYRDLAIVLVLIVACIAALIMMPKYSKPATVTRLSSIQYKVGEKVKVDPYASDQWANGTVQAVTSEDDYVVAYCGPYGWANHKQCETKALKRSQMAKVEKVGSDNEN